MNETILKFLKNQGIDKDKLARRDECRVYSDEDINWIISKYRVYKSSHTPQKISIADIKGYDYSTRMLSSFSLFENMGDFFNENGSGYERRSLSMLDIPTEQIVNELTYSFSREPICLSEADKGKYTISDNGLHRYHVLKAHYLKELSSIDTSDQEQIDNLREKYTIDVSVTETDYFKTYANYVLKLISNGNSQYGGSVKAEYDYEKFIYTGKSIVTDKKTRENLVLNDEELASYLKKNVVAYLTDKNTFKKDFRDFIDRIENAYDAFESFRDFYRENIAEIIPSKYITKQESKRQFEEEIECE